jgi:hypothetical protein
LTLSLLALRAIHAIFRRMKFAMALLTFATMAFILAWGIIAAVQPDGKPWLLAAAVLGYLVLFWRVGCAEEH